MTQSERKKSPDFFEDQPFDPVKAAMRQQAPKAAGRKKKAGFYLSEALLARFDRRFYEMKLAGRPVESKSALLELALAFALDDLDKEEQSTLLKALEPDCP